MRWKFPDPADVGEARARASTVEAIDRWWETFAANADAIDAAFSRGREFDIAGFTVEQLARVEPDLCWEYGSAIHGPGHRLVITPEGSRHRRPMVDALIKRAPRLPRWEFYAHRLPEPADIALPTATEISGYRPAAAPLVAVRLNEANRLDLTFQVPAADVDAHEGFARFLFAATEHLLGEEVLDRWVGYDGPAVPGETIATRAGGAVVAVERLKPTVDALISATREQLPPVPRHATAAQKKSSREWISYQLQSSPERKEYARWHDQFVGVTAEQRLIFATRANGFASERFSRCGETFCYLKLDGREGLDPAHYTDRGDVEEAVDGVLIAPRLGCVVGGGTGRVYSYIDLALTDVPAAIGPLRDVLRRGNAHRRSWLLFHDPEYADEWVGVYDETPAPPSDDPADEE